jgi:hypothetical protein
MTANRVREGWIQTMYSCWGYRECKQLRQLEKHIWNSVTVEEENIRIKLDKQIPNKPTVKLKNVNEQIRRIKNENSARGGGGHEKWLLGYLCDNRS